MTKQVPTQLGTADNDILLAQIIGCTIALEFFKKNKMIDRKLDYPFKNTL